MDDMMYFYIWTALATFGVCWFRHPIAESFRVMDTPGGRKKHVGAVPLVGGIAFAVAILPAIYFLFPGDDIGLAFSGGLLAIFLLGLWDDRTDIRPEIRLVITALAIGLSLAACEELEIRSFYMTSLDGPHDVGMMGSLLTVFMSVALLNAINMADGKNGIVIVSSLIWTTALYFVAPVELYPILRLAFFALAIILVFNLQCKLFLGDAGSYIISIFFALLATYVYALDPYKLPFDLTLLWFAIPCLDALRLITVRTLAGKSPMEGDRDHLHHLIYEVFQGKHVGLAIYSFMVAAPIVLAHFYQDYTAAILVSVVGLYVFTLTYLRSEIEKRTNLSAE